MRCTPIRDFRELGRESTALLWSLPKARLIGMDPFNIEQLAGPLRYYAGQSPRTVSSLEISLWDLIGKAAGQPLYKLWGAAKDRVPAYASMIQLSTPEERVRMAVQLKSQGWKAIELRAHLRFRRVGRVEPAGRHSDRWGREQPRRA